MRSTVYQADWLDQAPSTIDLRKHLNTPRTQSILDRAHLLLGPERDFIHAMYRDGQSAAEIARLGDLDPRQVRRKIKYALARLDNPLFIFVVTHKHKWSPTRRKVAQSLIQSGNSIRETAINLNLKVHEVRRHRTAMLDHYNNYTRKHTPPAPKHNTPDRNWKHTH